MAAAFRVPFRLTCFSQQCSLQFTPAAATLINHRPFSQSHRHRYEITNPTGTRPRKGRPSHRRKLKPQEKALIATADQESPLEYLSRDTPDSISKAEAKDVGELEEMPRDNTQGFFAEDEEGDDPGEDEDFEPDDITSTAHGELEQVRELRELERVTVWDMPLLYRHAKPFTPPTAAQPLRFRYTSYMGETHPGARKVVMDFTPSALPDLTSAQTTKLLKLLGARYDPLKNMAKMSCDRFPTVAQNKRALKELLTRLLTEARDSTDMFEDIPLDLRHVKIKNKTKGLKFPEAWNWTEQRGRYLEEAWRAKEADESRRIEEGRVVEGKRLLGTPVPEEEEFVTLEPRRRRSAR